MGELSRCSLVAQISLGLVLAGALGCQEEIRGTAGSTLSMNPSLAVSETALRVCANGPTIEGVDVSFWQGVIDWDSLVESDVQYAIIRTSYGTGTLDTQFVRNWSEATRVGMIRGVYHFFRANQDVEAQARIMLDRMGPMMPGMLPPTIDIETDEDEPPAVVRRKTLEWIAIVEAATGVRPMIYTRANVWDPLVGSLDYGAYPLWVAHYGTECPAIPQGWDTWTFHQYTDEGRAPGVDGNVDRNRFNGTRAELELLAGVRGGCGDGFCSPSETIANCSEDCVGCPALPAMGGYLSEEGDCFRPGGPRQYWRDEDIGYDGHLFWTHTTSNASPANFAEWTVHVSDSGDYEIEAHIDGPWSKSRQADYLVDAANGARSVRIDQNQANGWVSIGRFRFDAQQLYTVRMNDNTGEPNETMTKLVADDLRLQRVLPADSDMMPEAPQDAGLLEPDAGPRFSPDAIAPGVGVVTDGSLPESDQGRLSNGGVMLSPGSGPTGSSASGGCSVSANQTGGDARPVLFGLLIIACLRVRTRRRVGV
ncbi:MAG: GH25 family lysozyme [Myxococcota bacterium]|nr:GH25 family lysozyme [Myxococcota bacterium]